MSMPPHPALDSMTKVEQLAFLDYVEKSRREKMQLDSISEQLQKQMHQIDQQTYTVQSTKKEESKKLQKFLQSQIEFKKKNEREINELSKTSYNKALVTLPPDQACIFPKIKEDSPQDKLNTKKLMQQTHFNELSTQVKFKHNNNQQQDAETSNERRIADKAKELLDKELAHKKKLEKERQSAYKAELDRLVNDKNKQKQKEPAYASLPIGEECKDDPVEHETVKQEKPNEEEEELKIIDQYFKESQQDFKEANEANAETEKKEEGKSNTERRKTRESHSVATEEQNSLLKKIEDYERRKKQGGKSHISIEKLKQLALKNSNSQKILKPLESEAPLRYAIYQNQKARS
jgi:hypothetical protein